MKKHIFLTGLRQVGKSTLLNQYFNNFPGNIGGFQTLWKSDSLHLLPYGSREFSTNNRVAGRFDFARWRNPAAFDRLAPTLFENRCAVLVMDELGFFESNSPLFQSKILELLDENTPIFGVIKPQNTDFLHKIKCHPDVEIRWVTETNRNQLLDQLRKERPWENYINGSRK